MEQPSLNNTELFQKFFDNDPCLSGPCQFGKVCKSIVEEPKFICLNEIEETKEISDARKIYRNIELMYASAIYHNIEDLVKNGKKSQGFISPLKAKYNDDKNQTTVNPCLSDPCEDGFTCVQDENGEDGFVCNENVAIKQDDLVNAKSIQL